MDTRTTSSSHPGERDDGGDVDDRVHSASGTIVSPLRQHFGGGVPVTPRRLEEPSTPTAGIPNVERCMELPHREMRMDSIGIELNRGHALSWEVIRAARASSTMACYDSAFADWNQWLDRQSVGRSPLNLMRWLHTFNKTARARKALQLLAAVLFELKLRGEEQDYEDARIRLYAEGIYRTAPKFQRPMRDPVRIVHVATLAGMLDLNKQVNLRDVVILIIGLIGFARALELTTLTPEDVRRTGRHYTLTLNRCKTRIASSRAEVIVPWNDNMPVNPAKLLERYMRVRASTPALFSTTKGTRLSPQTVSQIVKRRLQEIKITGNFSSHSLRIGGAVLACEQGKTELEIRSLGGWKSNAIFQYVRDIVRIY